MILSITLNPSLIKTCIVDGFELNTNNEILDYKIEFDDGPVHSVQIIKTLQGEPLMIGYMGGPGGRFIKNYLEKNKIKSDFTWMDQEIKNTQIIIDSIKGTETILVDKGISIDEKVLKVFFQKLQNHISDITLVLLSGQMPVGMTEEDIQRTIWIASEKQKKVVISLEGDFVKKALEYKPYAVLLNEHNLKELDISIEDENKMLEECQNLLKEYRVKFLALDLEQRGIYTLTKNKICRAYYPKSIQAVRNKGIKDGILGCFALGLDRQYEQEKISKLMCAVRTALSVTPADEICQRKNIDYYTKRVKIEEVMSKSKGFRKISQ